MIIDLGGGIKVNVQRHRMGKDMTFSVTALSPNGVPFQVAGKIDARALGQILGQMREQIRQYAANKTYQLAMQGAAQYQEQNGMDVSTGGANRGFGSDWGMSAYGFGKPDNAYDPYYSWAVAQARTALPYGPVGYGVYSAGYPRRFR